VALASSFVMPVTFTIHAAAWVAVLLTLLAVWHAATVVRRVPFKRTVFEIGLVVLLVVLAASSLYWRVAGVTSAL
jgi:hypothetical protein